MATQMAFEELDLIFTAQAYFYICLNEINPGDHLLARNAYNGTYSTYRLIPAQWDERNKSWIDRKPEFIACLFPKELNEIAGFNRINE